MSKLELKSYSENREVPVCWKKGQFHCSLSPA